MRNLLYCLSLLIPLACAESVKQSDGNDETGGTAGSTSGGGQSAVTSGGANVAGGDSATRGGANAAAGAQSSGGSVATGGNTNVVLTECDLPNTSATSVAKPSGTPGNFKVLNWAGFTGAVSYTFDDGNQTQIDHYAELQALDVRMTFYLISGKPSASNSIWKQALLDGHELGNHTQSHAQTATEADIDAASTFLQSQYGVKAYTMAAPYGSGTYTPLAETRFLINRGVSNSLILPNGTANPFNLPCYIPATGALASTMNPQVDSAVTGGGWRVVLVHGFEGGADGAYQPVAISEFLSHVNYAKSLGMLWIDSVVNVGAYWRAQKLVSALTPTQSGTDSSWTWTLPSNFPPGKCLRVTVDGGTLKQNGKTLDWNDQGFYEIALDAGSVTLSP